ncbi:APC family permease [Pseudomonas oryzihabitans]|uniref:APC family permease n=1 Tax=Pseudomonas oryzihabitans TaxID=47885 RepID=UPI0028957335|nr:APC family permease [Pseudomonas oryzihabitans]MDT3722451.1 APC family permease [Pseudomonas oryzihabitans]
MNVSPSTPGTAQLRHGTLGVAMIVFFVISAASPLSVLAGGFPIGIMLGNGAGTPALLLAALGVLLCFAVGYTRLARHVAHAGGFYAFISRGLGGVWGGAAGMLAMVAYNILQVGIYGMFGAVVAGNFDALLGLQVPWWACSLAALVVVACLGYRNIDLSARLLSVMVVAEYLVILLLDAAILVSGGAHGVDFSAFTPTQVSSGNPAIGLLFCFAAFIGFEASTLYAEEAKNPQRTIPLATFIAVLLVGGFYTFSVWAMIVGSGADGIVERLQAMPDPITFLYGLSDQYVGTWLTQSIRLLFVVSLLAGLLAFHNAAARYFFATGRDGLLSPRLGRTHPRHQSPHLGSLLQSTIAAVLLLGFALAGADPVLQVFAWLSNLATLSLILLMVLTCLAVISYFRSHPEHLDSRLCCLVLPALSGLALFVIFLMALVHFDVLTGASTLISVALWSVVPLAALIGALLALRLRSTAPQRFDLLGSSPA